jgi:hypothetical protein
MSIASTTLSDRVENFPDPWVPEPGDKLIGEITEVATTDKGFGPYRLLTVVTESGSTERGGKAIPVGSMRVWHGYGTVAEAELKKLAPEVGDRIAVKYFGVREGTVYKAYRLIVERKTPPMDGAGGAASVPDGPTPLGSGAEEATPAADGAAVTPPQTEVFPDDRYLEFADVFGDSMAPAGAGDLAAD